MRFTPGDVKRQYWDREWSSFHRWDRNTLKTQYLFLISTNIFLPLTFPFWNYISVERPCIFSFLKWNGTSCKLLPQAVMACSGLLAGNCWTTNPSWDEQFGQKAAHHLLELSSTLWLKRVCVCVCSPRTFWECLTWTQEAGTEVWGWFIPNLLSCTRSQVWCTYF